MEAVLPFIYIALHLLTIAGLIYIYQSLRRRILMSTAQLLALLQESEQFTAEIASDIDPLLEIVNNPNTEVPAEIAIAASSLKDKLVAAAAKYSAE